MKRTFLIISFFALMAWGCSGSSGGGTANAAPAPPLSPGIIAIISAMSIELQPILQQAAITQIVVINNRTVYGLLP